MQEPNFISDAELQRHYRSGPLDDWSDRVTALLNHQRRNWDQAREGYAALTQSRMKRLGVERSTVYAQFNSGRMRTAILNTDPMVVRTRPCQLCTEHRPAEQLALPYGEFLIVANPAPILPEHLTVIDREHRPQALGDLLPTMLKLAADLARGYTVIYNGPGAGASAPQHRHLQACRRGALPIERDELCDWREPALLDTGGLTVHAAGAMARRAWRLRSSAEPTLIDAARILLDRMRDDGAGPALNAVCRYLEPAGAWTLVIFPRRCDRPACYFAEGDARMLVRPGAFEMSGLMVFPRLEDFERVDAEVIAGILDEVSQNPTVFDRISDQFSEALQG